MVPLVMRVKQGGAAGDEGGVGGGQLVMRGKQGVPQEMWVKQGGAAGDEGKADTDWAGAKIGVSDVEFGKD